MEELYSTLLPYGQVHCMTWSGNNLVAVSLSEELPENITEGNERMKVSSLAVFDPDRPWIFHKVVSECRSVVSQLEWCQDGTRLLALDQNNVIHIWRMKQQNINTWVCAQKQEPDPPSISVVHAAWLEYRPKVTINHSKQAWPEALEFQQFSPLIKMLTGNAFICVYSNGKVQVTSTNLNYGTTLKAETKLEGKSTMIVVAKTFVTPNGSVLCAVGYEDGQVRVYSVSLSLSWGSEFTLASSLATEVPRTSSFPDTITHLAVLPLPDGCILHTCYNGTELCQWSVKDITTSGSYQAKKEKVYTSPSPISCLCASSLCLCSQDTAADNEIIVLDEMSGVQSEGRGWPVEVLVVTTQAGDIIVLNRDTCKELHRFQLTPHDDPLFPVPKRARLLSPSSHSSSPTSPLAACLSPNAGCAAIATRGFIHLLHLGSLLLGVKDSTVSPEVPRCSRLLSLATVTQQSPWDLVVMLARVDNTPAFLQRVLAHYQTDYQSNASTVGEHLSRHYLTTCSLIHSCSEDGLYTVLGYRNISRLHATSGLLGLSLMAGSSDTWLMDTLTNVCSGSAGEESVETLSEQLELSEFIIKPGTSLQLQGHVHWLLELAIKLVSTLPAANTTSLPEPSALELLRQGLLLVYVWNKTLPHPIIPVADGALSLLFKVLTKYIHSPSTAFPDDLLTEISGNIPSEKHPNLLTLTKAAHLQGFLNGVVSCKLPEVYQQNMPPSIRQGVQQNFTSMDPYSPLTLVVPRGLSSPWRDCFMEEQIHGGVIMKCRCWTVVPDSLQAMQAGEVIPALTTHPVQQWRHSWAAACLCGGLWTVHVDTGNSKRT
jgi:hypothetical protein